LDLLKLLGNAAGYYAFCAAKCNVCFVPEAWPLFIDIYGHSSSKLQIFDDLGRRCSAIYGMSRTYMKPEFLLEKIDAFVGDIHQYSGINLKPQFNVLNKSLHSLVKYGNIGKFRWLCDQALFGFK
jgi:hypothetical protein